VGDGENGMMLVQVTGPVLPVAAGPIEAELTAGHASAASVSRLSRIFTARRRCVFIAVPSDAARVAGGGGEHRGMASS